MLRAARAVAAGACALVVLAGCGSKAPSLVAEVGSDRITESQLTTAYDGVRQALGAEAQVNRQGVIDALVRGVICEQLISQNNLVITDTERDATLSSDDTGKALLTVPEAKAVAYDLADEQLVAQRLGAEQYTSALAAAKVTVNPRYGSWGTIQGQTGLIGVPGSLSSPATPTPAN